MLTLAFIKIVRYYCVLTTCTCGSVGCVVVVTFQHRTALSLLDFLEHLVSN